jgi:hypothetical protein
VLALRDLGVEADVILFHPYDRWGFADLGAEADDRLVRYAVRRLAAFSNVWWAMANEYDLMAGKTEADWSGWPPSSSTRIPTATCVRSTTAFPSTTTPDRRSRTSFAIDVIDTWNMTVERVAERVAGKVRVELPGRQYMAIRVIRASR